MAAASQPGPQSQPPSSPSLFQQRRARYAGNRSADTSFNYGGSTAAAMAAAAGFPPTGFVAVNGGSCQRLAPTFAFPNGSATVYEQQATPSHSLQPPLTQLQRRRRLLLRPQRPSYDADQLYYGGHGGNSGSTSRYLSSRMSHSASASSAAGSQSGWMTQSALELRPPHLQNQPQLQQPSSCLDPPSTNQVVVYVNDEGTTETDREGDFSKEEEGALSGEGNEVRREVKEALTSPPPPLVVSEEKTAASVQSPSPVAAAATRIVANGKGPERSSKMATQV